MGSVNCRAHCAMKASVGCGVIPVIYTLRVLSSNQHQDIIGDQATPRSHLHGEEVHRGQNLPMESQELCPTHTGLASSGCGIKMVATQDVAHGARVNLVPQVRQGSLNAAIAPARILLSHADDQLFDLLDHARSTQAAAVVASVELLRDEAMIPAHQGIWGSNRGQFFEACATDRMGECREAPAFHVRQAEPAATKLIFQDAVFLVQVGDNLLLVTLEPATDHGDQDGKEHGRSSGWRHDGIVRSSIHPTCAISMR
jgi:hypothetical protein